MRAATTRASLAPLPTYVQAYTPWKAHAMLFKTRIARNPAFKVPATKQNKRKCIFNTRKPPPPQKSPNHSSFFKTLYPDPHPSNRMNQCVLKLCTTTHVVCVVTLNARIQISVASSISLLNRFKLTLHVYIIIDLSVMFFDIDIVFK